MEEHPFPQKDPGARASRDRFLLRTLLMFLITGLILFLLLYLLSQNVSPQLLDRAPTSSQPLADDKPTQTAPQPDVVPGSSSSGAMQANPGAAPEYSLQILDTSGGRSGLFEQLSQKTFSDFQHCAENLNYTARIENSWDIWRLIFYTIYFQAYIPTTVPAACQQLVADYGSNGQSEFLTALGADWWRQDPSPSNGPPLLIPDCSTSVECDLQQAAVALMQMQGSVLLIPCQNQLVPSALCTASVSDFELACTEELDYTGSLNDLHAAVFDAYAINFGDIPPSCVLYAGIPLLTNEVVQATQAGVQHGISCAVDRVACQAIGTSSPDLSLAEMCAQNIQWSNSIVEESQAVELVEYLAAAAPWLPPGSMPSSCTQLLIAAAPTEAGGAYWQFLGKSLSERQIENSP